MDTARAILILALLPACQGDAHETMARGLNRPCALAIQADMLYFAECGGHDDAGNFYPGAITALPLAGGPSQVLAVDDFSDAADPESQFGIGSVAFDADAVYWVWQTTRAWPPRSRLMRAPTDGSAQLELMASARIPTVAASDDALFVVTFQVDGTQSTLYRLPKTGGAPSIVHRNGAYQRMVADASGVYWIERDSILSVPLLGGDSRVVAAGLVEPHLLAIDGETLYFGDSATPPPSDSNLGDWLIGRVPLAGGEPVIVISDLPNHVSDFDFDAERIYWSAVEGGTIESLPKTGGSAPTVIASGEDRPGTVVLHDGYIYWTAMESYPYTNGTIRRAQLEPD